MNAKNFFSKIIFAALFFAAFGASQIFAQPTDAQLRKPFSKPGITVVFHKPGKKVWSPSYSKWVWEIGFTSKFKDADNPGLFIIVDGISSYDIIGGRYVFWRTFTTENRYEGLPNPTDADVKRLLDKFGLDGIMDTYYSYFVGGKAESFKLSKDPKFEWHTPNSVSFNITAIYVEDLNIGETPARVAREYRLRLYRDDTKSEWNKVYTDKKDKVAF